MTSWAQATTMALLLMTFLLIAELGTSVHIGSYDAVTKSEL
jgi:hypothetical protein